MLRIISTTNNFTWWVSQVFIFWVAPLAMSTLIQKLAVFIFWPLEHAHVIGHVLSARHVTPQSHSTCDMWHVYTGSSPFPSSFFVEFEGTDTSEMREAKPTLVSQTTFVTLLPCIIHDVCHVMCKVEHDASPHPPPPPWQSRVHSDMTEPWPPHALCRVHNYKQPEESSRFYNALTASDF